MILKTFRRTSSSFLLACAAAAFGSGCAARVYSTGPGPSYPAGVAEDTFVYDETVPVNIETYPHYYYGDGYAYYVDGRWYRRSARGWGYYRQEPPELEHHRVYGHLGSEAPPARPYVQQAPEVAPPRVYERQTPEPPAREQRPYVRQDAPRERPALQPAPPAPVPGTALPYRGAAEAQPRRDEPRHDAPRTAPPAERERRPDAPHEDHAAPQREQRAP